MNLKIRTTSTLFKNVYTLLNELLVWRTVRICPFAPLLTGRLFLQLHAIQHRKTYSNTDDNLLFQIIKASSSIVFLPARPKPETYPGHRSCYNRHPGTTSN